MVDLPENNFVEAVKAALNQKGLGLTPPLDKDIAANLKKRLYDIDPDLDPTLPEDLVVFLGFAGRSTRGAKYHRLYVTLELNEYIEFSNDDLVYSLVIDLQTLQNMKANVVWLRREASIRHVRSETISLQRGFLQGGIGGLGASLQMGGSQGNGMGSGSNAPWCGGGSNGPWCGGGSNGPWCGGGSNGPWCGGGSSGPWCGGGSGLWCGGAGWG